MSLGERQRKKPVEQTKKRRGGTGEMRPFTNSWPQSSRFILTGPLPVCCTCFYSGAPLPPHPDPMGTTDDSTMETVCMPWMTDLSIQATRNPPSRPTPPLPPQPCHPVTHTHIHTYKQMDCITDFPFSGAVFHGIRSRQTWRRILVIRLQIIEQECLRWEPRGGSDKTAGWLHVPPMMIRSCVALTWWAEKLMRGLIIACNWFTCFHFFPFSMCAACLWACCIMNHQHLKRGPNSSPGIVNIYW